MDKLFPIAVETGLAYNSLDGIFLTDHTTEVAWKVEFTDEFETWWDSLSEGEQEEISVLFAFDPRRAALLLIGGDKTGNPKWYEEFVPIADDLFDQHLKEIDQERKK